MRLCSACLLGLRCVWDGTDSYKNDKVIEILKKDPNLEHSEYTT